MTIIPTTDALAGAAQSTSDSQATPAEIRRHVLAALIEREQLGDNLARGAVRVIRHLEAQANALAAHLPYTEPYGSPSTTRIGTRRAANPRDAYVEHCEAKAVPASPCPVTECAYCAEDGQ